MRSSGRGDRRRYTAEDILGRYSAERLAELHEEALEWRDKWRNGAPLEPESEEDEKDEAAAQRARFAAAVARAEFGRFYWQGPRPQRSRRNGKGRGPIKRSG